MVLDPCFTCWEPVTLIRRELADFINFVKVIKVLDVSRVVPSEDIGLFTIDQVNHCLDPSRVFNTCQPSILCILDNFKNITTFKSVAIVAGTAFNLPELGACFAFLGW